MINTNSVKAIIKNPNYYFNHNNSINTIHYKCYRAPSIVLRNSITQSASLLARRLTSSKVLYLLKLIRNIPSAYLSSSPIARESLLYLFLELHADPVPTIIPYFSNICNNTSALISANARDIIAGDTSIVQFSCQSATLFNCSRITFLYSQKLSLFCCKF